MTDNKLIIVLKGCTLTLNISKILSITLFASLVMHNPENFHPIHLSGVDDNGNNVRVELATMDELFDFLEQVHYCFEMLLND